MVNPCEDTQKSSIFIVMFKFLLNANIDDVTVLSDPQFNNYKNRLKPEAINIK